MDRRISVTTAVMSYDDLELLDVQNGPRDNDDEDGFEEVGYGCYFFVEATGSSAYGLEVVFGDNTTPDSEVLVQFFEVDPAVGINDDSNDNFPLDELASAEYIIPASVLGESVYIPFDDVVDLDVDLLYFASVLQFEGVDEVWVMATENTDTDNSSYIRELSGDGNYVWFSRPDENAVRLSLNLSLNVEDIASVKESLTVSPNPFNESTMIEYTLDADKIVSYKLYDINGRLVEQEKLGNQASGNHSIKIDASSLDAGIYYFNLRVGDSAITEKLIITK